MTASLERRIVQSRSSPQVDNPVLEKVPWLASEFVWFFVVDCFAF